MAKNPRLFDRMSVRTAFLRVAVSAGVNIIQHRRSLMQLAHLPLHNSRVDSGYALLYLIHILDSYELNMLPTETLS